MSRRRPLMVRDPDRPTVARTQHRARSRRNIEERAAAMARAIEREAAKEKARAARLPEGDEG